MPTHPPEDLKTPEQIEQWRQIVILHHKNSYSSSAYCSDDGSFHIDNVPPGQYKLSARVQEESGGSPNEFKPPTIKVIASVVEDVVVPPQPDDSVRTPVDLGTIKIKAYHKPSVGEDAVLFEAKTLDGKPLRLSSFRGKYIVLDLRSVLGGREGITLEALSQTYAKDERLVIITLCYVTNPDFFKELSETGSNNWIQGYLGDTDAATWPKNYGFYSYDGSFMILNGAGLVGRGGGPPVTPERSVFLIGPDGKFLAVNLALDDLQNAVAHALAGK